MMKNNKKYIAACFLGLIIFVISSCEKNVFETSETNDPIIFFRADLDGVPFDFTIGDSLKVEKQFIIEDTSMRYFVIYMNDAKGLRSIRMIFNNYKSPYSNYLSDLDSTIKIGLKEYTEFFPPSNNPLQTGRVSIEFNDNGGNIYSTVPALKQNGFFSIDSVYLKRWGNGKLYKIFKSSFECKMYDIYVADSIIVKNGKATLALEYEE